ncbi:hypothetical protein [uncultured Thiocystis sp.]|jgi:hypothetical protein|uniref:hypothetical protein n=1 Tax=uncultured Thiocystis sp. TaxID=1202134 RepID=UPI0025E670F1|nr:hypothetical protein [uncultured Thiocystis sp.]
MRNQRIKPAIFRDEPKRPARIFPDQLADLLHAERIPPRAVYRPGEVCQLLRISRSTLLALCGLAEHPAARPANPRALDSFLVGCHHRIAHASLVVWLERNQKFQRDSA